MIKIAMMTEAIQPDVLSRINCSMVVYSSTPEIKRAHHKGTPVIISLAEWTGLEPATSAVTGQHSNQLNYHSGSIWWVLRGSNPRPSPCKGDALPAELSTQGGALVYGILECFSSFKGRDF